MGNPACERLGGNLCVSLPSSHDVGAHTTVEHVIKGEELGVIPELFKQCLLEFFTVCLGNGLMHDVAEISVIPGSGLIFALEMDVVVGDAGESDGKSLGYEAGDKLIEPRSVLLDVLLTQYPSVLS